jgi:quercetin 2,3-dioxygenase
MSKDTLLISPRKVTLTVRSELEILRLLPHRDLRAIGAFVFLDYYGPTAQRDGMTISAHPHTGLQTVSWLFSGEIDHRDSIGSAQIITPGQLNLMTAGKGIAHSEKSLDTNSPLHGVQLWIALPDSERDEDPFFEHHSQLPMGEFEGFDARVFLGENFGLHSPAKVFSPLIAAEITMKREEISIEARTGFEYGALLISGASEELEIGEMLYFSPSEKAIDLTAASGSRFLLLGGEPFPEPYLMWWNFIGRNHEEIEKMRSEWNLGLGASKTYAEFKDNVGGVIPAPELPNLKLRAR